MTNKQAIEDFLNQKSIAVVGVSRNKTKFGNAIFTELVNRNYNVYPVNPNLNTFEGRKCYASLKDLPQGVECAILSVKPEEAKKIVVDAKEAGIKRIWFQQGCKSDEAICFCKENSINEIHNQCILMHAEPVVSIHKFHRWLWKLIGQFPK
jgi:hypothetical protein